MATLLIIGLVILGVWYYYQRNNSSIEKSEKETLESNTIETNPVNGKLGYFRLGDWWKENFTEEERIYIMKIYSPLSSQQNDEITLINGNISYCSETATTFLGNLSGWFKKSDDRSIGYRCIKKAEELKHNINNILDLHFLYQNKIELYFKFRFQDNFALDEAILACKDQISLSSQAKLAFKKEYKGELLPCHTGFETLIKIEMQKGNFESALELALTANKEKWFGDWKEIIKECKLEMKD